MVTLLNSITDGGNVFKQGGIALALEKAEISFANEHSLNPATLCVWLVGSGFVKRTHLR